MRRNSRPMSSVMMEKAKRGANRLEALLQGHLDPAELYDALGAAKTSAMARFSRKFYKSARELMDRFGTKYGDDSKRALAHLISISVRKEDFSINYDSWLRSLEMLADALHAKGIDVPSIFRFSFSRVARECETCRELDASARVLIEYAERFGSPGSFCSDVLPYLVSLRLPAAEFVNFCDVLMEKLEAAGAGRGGLLEAVCRELHASATQAPENARKLIDFLRALPSSS